MRSEIAVLGQGQLGWMLRAAAERLGVPLKLLAPNQVELPPESSLITVESEHWPDNEGVRALQRHPGWCNGKALSILPDRRTQKQMLDDLQLATAPWCIPQPEATLETLRAHLGPDFLLKSARGGYDGRGQHRVPPGSTEPLPDWRAESIAEAAVNFETEVSLVGARAKDGHCVFYRLTENYHSSGILMVSISRADRFSEFQAQAETMLSKIMNHLDYVGVMAMECFVRDGDLLINELAPRVHNSGHWTQAGASISQFELHLRSLLGWPMPVPDQSGVAVMVNLIGLGHQPQWLSVPGAQLYWYGKELRKGRKMGHVNFHHAKPEQVAQWLTALQLPEAYSASVEWAEQRLVASSAG